MFFDDLAALPQIALRNGTSLFILPREQKIDLPGAIVLEPTDKATITIDQVRALSPLVTTRQTRDLTILIRPADLLNLEAENALLKTLEQPGDHVHFVLVTDRPEEILPTIRSRAAIYYLRTPLDFSAPIPGDEHAKNLARALLTAKDAALVPLAQDLTKTKDNPKAHTLNVLRLAIEIAYKSYFRTANPAFLDRLERLIATYEKIASGGNLKLQIVANLA